MAKDSKTVVDFLDDLYTRFKPLAEKDRDSLLALKRQEAEEQGKKYDPTLYVQLSSLSRRRPKLDTFVAFVSYSWDCELPFLLSDFRPVIMNLFHRCVLQSTLRREEFRCR
jgi:hypothetical protein